MTKRYLLAATVAALFALSGCFNGSSNGGGGGGNNPGGSNTAPTANAGSDQAATQGDTVSLDGSQSSDPETPNDLTFAWTQTSGISTTLINPNSASPSFVAPTVTEQSNLVFELTVTDPDGLSDDDTVTVVVNPPNVPEPVVLRDRYEFNNQCFAIKADNSGKYIVADGNGFAATGDDAASAEAFYFKPAVLGSYMLYDRARQLVDTTAGIARVELAAAQDNSIFTVITDGDDTDYPEAIAPFEEPTLAAIDAYQNFVDPERESDTFNLLSHSGQALSSTSEGALSLASLDDDDTAQEFSIEPLESGCSEFPEAQSNTVGETFKGSTADGRVLGMADVHVHISSTDFLGRAQWGSPFHKHGVMHALGEDCEEYHGPNGAFSVTETVYSQDFDGHNTTGWPTFPDWPARNNLFHEAIYWKWLERAWMSGLRVVVNDLVDNETLCELSRNAAMQPNIDCNSMNNAGRQAGTMYAMQDYIDAQMGGRGKGWYQIVRTPEEGRQVIEDGLMAVVLGIEISNFLNCKVNYGLAPQQEAWQETGAGIQPDPENGIFPIENSYTCTEETIVEQIQRIHDWGVRQVITIHEFDNAFGGNGIFGGLVLNLGNREDSGGIPGGALANPGIPGSNPEFPLELPSGQFWTTYDCPVEGENGFDYLWSDKGGDDLESLDPTCPYLGQGNRPGGPTPCYPAANNFAPDQTTKQQCNARWLTPIGLFTYGKLMEAGMIFDIDHLELEMKTQALELAEAQDPPYPFVSTHGTFGGTSMEQASRILANKGFLYPSLGNGSSLISRMGDIRQAFADANLSNDPNDPNFEIFGFGFGTDTNGLSGQAGSPNGITISYPYTLFSGGKFDELEDFDDIDGVVFNQPNNIDIDGTVARTWDINHDGSAHYGMLSGMVEEVNQKGTKEDLKALFDSAERYLQTWTATLASQAGILAKVANDTDGDGQGNVVDPGGILRPAPTPPCELGRRLLNPVTLANPECQPSPP